MSTSRAAGPVHDEAQILAIERPHPNLLRQYAIQALAGLFLFPFIFLPLFFRYHTLRYRFDDEGVSAAWGILFRREVQLTYRRIQDIHVRRNVIERWLGIGRVELQTASGSASSELVLEGMADHEAVRDFLYRRMRGHEAAPQPRTGVAVTAGAAAPPPTAEGEAVALLREIKTELEELRRALARRGPA